MNGENEFMSFVKVWITATTCLCYCFYLGSKFPKGFLRLFSLLPVLSLFTTLPFRLSTVHLGAPTAFFLTWLANFKLLLFAFDHGPLSSLTQKSLFHFILAAFFPIKFTQDEDPSGKGGTKTNSDPSEDDAKLGPDSSQKSGKNTKPPNSKLSLKTARDAKTSSDPYPRSDKNPKFHSNPSTKSPEEGKPGSDPFPKSDKNTKFHSNPPAKSPKESEESPQNGKPSSNPSAESPKEAKPSSLTSDPSPESLQNGKPCSNPSAELPKWSKPSFPRSGPFLESLQNGKSSSSPSSKSPKEGKLSSPSSDPSLKSLQNGKLNSNPSAKSPKEGKSSSPNSDSSLESLQNGKPSSNPSAKSQKEGNPTSPSSYPSLESFQNGKSKSTPSAKSPEEAKPSSLPSDPSLESLQNGKPNSNPFTKSQAKEKPSSSSSDPSLESLQNGKPRSNPSATSPKEAKPSSPTSDSSLESPQNFKSTSDPSAKSPKNTKRNKDCYPFSDSKKKPKTSSDRTFLESNRSSPTKRHPSNSANTGAIFRPFLFAAKAVLLFTIFTLYKHHPHLHPYLTLALYCCHVYLEIEIILALIAAPPRAIFGGNNFELQFNEPYLATSLQDFWGRRWNLMVTNILRPTVYHPVFRTFARVVGSRWALLIAILATFLVSGLMHEWIYFYLTRASPTWEVTGFFVLHGFCVAAEVLVKMALTGRCWLHRAISGPLAVGFVAVTGDWLFFPQLLRNGIDVKVIKEFSTFVDFVKWCVSTVFLYCF